MAGDPESQARVRAAGGGRKSLTETDPELEFELKSRVDPATRGDPVSALVWTTKSTRNMGALQKTEKIVRYGHAKAGSHRVSNLFKETGQCSSIRGNYPVVVVVRSGFALILNTDVSQRVPRHSKREFLYLSSSDPDTAMADTLLRGHAQMIPRAPLRGHLQCSQRLLSREGPAQHILRPCGLLQRGGLSSATFCWSSC